jgi:LacI family transcriptional regulator, galactose operon repressor
VAGEPRKARATLASVASAAGVSKATVSKVLNGRQDVNAETRARVAQVLEEHRYVPRARRPANARRIFEVVFDGFRSPYTLEIIRGATEAAGEMDVDVVIGPAIGDTPTARWVQRIAAAAREGVIVVTSDLSDDHRNRLADAKVPVVVIDPIGVPGVDVTSVGAMNWAGGLAATEHLLQLGHRRIGVLGGRPDALSARARVHGYHAALDTAGIPADPALVRHGDFGYDTALDHGLELLALQPRPTGVFATNDLQAFGVIEAARMRQLRVPDDLSVVGFDDLPIARWAAPPLTTVRQPLADIGRVALRVAARLAAGETLDTNRIELATELVIRESTAPPGTQPDVP